MMMLRFALALSLVTMLSAQEKVRVIAFGAHPDDCDIGSSGLAAILAKAGHAVKFVSVTNGDAGHQTLGGGALAKRRYAETQEVAKRLGITYDVLSNHDGELLPTLEVRLQVIRKIREWNADIVIAPRPNDYHPDHRYTGVLVQDAAYMVVVPNVLPDSPPLRKNPVFLYYQDRFKKPAPFRPDIVVDITGVYSQKVQALDAHESQVYEWLPWVDGKLDEVPKGKAERLVWLAKWRSKTVTDEIRASLTKWYGPARAAKVEQYEAFEICEYGKQPTEADLRRMFPFLKVQ
jgi:LmbE family N-acetylglucosaminyl deacetylase